MLRNGHLITNTRTMYITVEEGDTTYNANLVYMEERKKEDKKEEIRTQKIYIDST